MTELENLSRDFAEWRRIRVKYEHVPESLKARTIHLMDEYSNKELSSELKVTQKSLKKWYQRSHIEPKTEAPAQDMGFITLPPTRSVNPNMDSGAIGMELSLPGQMTLKFNDASIEQIERVVRGLINLEVA